MTLWDWLLNPAGLTAHGFCLSWAPGLIALHAGSDAVIGLAYFSIPLALVWFVRERRDLQYGWIAYLFGAFILACGTTHLFSILTLWVPVYGLEGLVKAVTAALSIATAAALWPLVPRLLALPSPTQLRVLNAELEQRVAERTAELKAANDQLTEALAERTDAQQALARTEAEFRASFEGAAVGKAQLDPVTGQILRANRAYARMLGYEVDDLVGRSRMEIVLPEDQEADWADYRRLLKGQIDVYISEKQHRRRDRSPLWVRVSATIARRPESQEPFLIITVIEDIDARYKAEAELLAAKVRLEALVEERTAALRQRDLLLREVYHRVKNNLQTVDSLLLMQARKLTDPQARQALISLRGRVYALGLVHHQLMGSANLKTFDIAPFLQELSSNILESGDNASVRLSVEACPLDVGLDFAIPLGLLVTELVTNSLKHAFAGGAGHISVALRREPDGEVVLVVGDNGRGAFGGDDSGSGLGVSIVRGLVAQLEGTMTVTNEGGMKTEIRTPMPRDAAA